MGKAPRRSECRGGAKREESLSCCGSDKVPQTQAVQPCAPRWASEWISTGACRPCVSDEPARIDRPATRRLSRHQLRNALCLANQLPRIRSEERRVGKE